MMETTIPLSARLSLPRAGHRPVPPVAARRLARPRRYRLPLNKRVFDVLVAGGLLLLLLPLLAVVALLVWLESPGPVFYYSPRVGTNYRVFRFWKFRSMRPDADQLLASLQHRNQYQAAEPSAAPTADCICPGPNCQQQLIDRHGQLVCERRHRQQKSGREAGAFLKVANDPRVTRVGSFIRNTSIDELPQLWNVLCGDMSLVGNRPLPLYEAEKLTADQYAARFLAPAGITGLWQVSKRGRVGAMSAEERKQLDVTYARTCSFGQDLRIILRTIPALFQQENV